MIRVIALGNEDAGDDAAAIVAARRARGAEIVIAGRPGVALLDLLDDAVPTVLVDVVKSGAAPGHVHEMPLDEVARRAVVREHVSSHGLGPSEALRLAVALGRALPRGRFVGIEGARFDPGAPLSREVEGAIDALAARIDGAIAGLRGAAAREG